MNNLFGTDGIRSSVGSFPLTYDGMPKLGQAIGTWMKRKYVHTPRVLIAEDSRLSGPMLKHSIISGLTRYPIKVYDAGILTTPAVFQLVQKQQLFDCGIIISASHNSYDDNGIKIVNRTTGRILARDEKAITEILCQRDFHPINYKLLGAVKTFQEAKNKYKACLKNYFEPNFLSGKTVALDCANGATSFLAREIFEEFGATVFVTKDRPNGRNINLECGSTYTESIRKFTLLKKADIGFSFDGDGDRVFICTKDGTIRDGDEILAVLLTNAAFKNERAVVSTNMSNLGFSEFVRSKKLEHLTSNVGEKAVITKLIHEGLLLGGEPSGHVIMRDYLSCSDSIFVALRSLETIITTNNWNAYSFKKYPQTLINLPIKVKHNLKQEPFNSLLLKYKLKAKDERIVVRYSGTEPVLRVMVESKNGNQKAIAEQFVEEYRSLEKGIKNQISTKKVVHAQTI